MEFPLRGGVGPLASLRLDSTAGVEEGARLSRPAWSLLPLEAFLKHSQTALFFPVSEESVISEPPGHFMTVLSQPRILTLLRSGDVVGGEGV